MLSYNLEQEKGPIYKNLYNFIKKDILTGNLTANQKLPSKRTFAKNLGVSTISIENAYDQLISEGFIYTLPKKGYFVSELPYLNTQNLSQPAADFPPQFQSHESQSQSTQTQIHLPEQEPGITFDFSSNRIQNSSFPFSVWTKVMRAAISQNQKDLLQSSPCGGIPQLRTAIAQHLHSFRGMNINPDQIIVGAGTEYLYSLLIKLLGTDKTYCLENPGYLKLKQIYQSNNANCTFASLDSKGLRVDQLQASGAQIAHISPTHHFPTGITMPISRRYELLAWANQNPSNFIIEDDYDSEFRLNGKPIPTLQSLDTTGKVIYMNTFSKSLSSTIRISYMILPPSLANLFYTKLNFYSCTVSTFEQHTLAAFISQGHFEKHINRMRLHYGKQRTQVIKLLRQTFTPDQCTILENDSGLHFILQFNTALTDQDLQQKLLTHKIKISSVSDFQMAPLTTKNHQFLLNYSNLDLQSFQTALPILRKIVFGDVQ